MARPWLEASIAAADRVNIREDDGSVDLRTGRGPLGPWPGIKSTPPSPQPIHVYLIFPAVTGPVSSMASGTRPLGLGAGGREEGGRGTQPPPEHQGGPDALRLRARRGPLGPWLDINLRHGTELGGLWGAEFSKTLHRGQGPRGSVEPS